MPWIVLSSVVCFLLIVYLFLSAPSGKRRAVLPFLSVRYAHRGLHGDGVAENSLTAFAKAKNAGFGIELDVRVSSDGEVVVFHDPTLLRVCGIDRRVCDMTADELSRLSLCGTEDGVPTLREVLSLVDGRVPLLIEIKEDTMKDRDVVPRLLPLLDAYDGPVLIESFNPLSLGRVKRSAPHLVRGLLCDAYARNPKGSYRALSFRLLERFLLNFIARPQFLAYNHTQSDFLPLRFFRALYRPTMFAWTVTSQNEERIARAKGFRGIIFEQYLPNDNENGEEST